MTLEVSAELSSVVEVIQDLRIRIQSWALCPSGYRSVENRLQMGDTTARSAARTWAALRNQIRNLAGAAGLEPATCGFGDRCSAN